MGRYVNNAPVTGLILSGGGARAAYQVGVLSMVAELLPPGAHNPFKVIVGTSAGAINATVLACGALQFGLACQRLTHVWQNFRTHQVYRSDWWGVTRQASRFLGQNLLGLRGHGEPTALLDNAPLRELLSRELDFSGITAAVKARQLQAIAVTAFGYESGHSMTFYQGHGAIDPWLRHRRAGFPTRLTVEHLMASTAIPLIFPPVKVGREYLGDGSVRQAAPISPALHLGASRVLIVGVSAPEANGGEDSLPTGQPPTLAQISGHLLNSTFIDNLESDAEVIKRVNFMSRLIPPTERTARLGVKPIETLIIAPSEPLADIAARHRRSLPRALRLFLRGPGATEASGSAVLSYLLFESGYCSELIALGRRDAQAQRDQLLAFLNATESTGEPVCQPPNCPL
ncbi:NTE family protein [Pseudomonas duriflava]|uniref:NTE family protein n=1 Tax=Pseudomonas duriflava TaxID=459528 RepID=A0A562QFW9_9PSED|nr:patatin-like phospholipase family protein [Pseudomonas duriflava]TWI55657.1 NTE family protein [Pseudomonas duriflava]